MEHLANFDTHGAVKRLLAVGLEDKVAEEIVASMVLSRDYDLSKLVTKDEFFKSQQKNAERFNSFDKRFDAVDKEIALIHQEIKNLTKQFKSDNEALRKDTKSEFSKVDLKIDALKKDVVAEIAKSKTETIKWLVGLFVGSAVAYFIKSHF